MKIKKTHKNTEDDNDLKSALIKILTDLNVELPENVNTLKTGNNEGINMKAKDIKNEI